MKRGDPIRERSAPELPPADERPADLPPWLDTLQPGDPVPERSEPEPPPANERPADRPLWVDDLQPGDPVPERGKPELPPADERPADLPPWVDALRPGDPSPERSAPEPPPADERPADLPPWLDALQRDDPVDDESASLARAVAASSPVDLRVTDSEDGVILAWDAVAEAVAYRVEYRGRGTASWLVAGYVFYRTSFTVDDLDCGTTYEFQVRPRGDGVPLSRTDGDFSDAVATETRPCTPAPPDNLWMNSTRGEASLGALGFGLS